MKVIADFEVLASVSHEVERLAALLRQNPDSASVRDAYTQQVDLLRVIAESIEYQHESTPTQMKILEEALEKVEMEMEQQGMVPAVGFDEDDLLELSMHEFEKQSENAEPNTEDDATELYPTLAPSLDHTTATTNSNDAAPLASEPEKSTKKFSALSQLQALPSTFRGLQTDDDCFVRSPVAMQAFVAEARRWLELTNGASAESQLALLQRTKLDKEDIIEAAFTSTVFRPSYYIAVDHSLKCVVLAIRSTKSFSDLLTDYNYNPVRFGESNGWAHEGMARAARWFDAHVCPRLIVVREMYGDYRLRVLGHSLGAGVATLLCLLARQNTALRDAEAIVFAPPCCVCPVLATETRRFVTSIVNRNDILPFLAHQSAGDVVRLLSPSAAFGSLLGNVSAIASAHKQESAPVDNRPLLRASTELATEFVNIQRGLPEHVPKPLYPSLDQQVAKVETPPAPAAEKPKQEEAASELVVPGVVYHILENNRQLLLEVDVDVKRFASLHTVSLSMLNAHRKRAYFDSLDALEKFAKK